MPSRTALTSAAAVLVTVRRARGRRCSTSRWSAARCSRPPTGGTWTSAPRRSIRRSAALHLLDRHRHGKRLHPDFGPPPYGIPYVVVAGDQPRVPVTFRVRRRERHRHPGPARLSDSGRGADAAALHRRRRPGRRHVRRSTPADHRSRSLAALRDVRDAVERDGWRWEAGSGAVFDLSVNGRRPGDVDVGRCRRPRDLSRSGALRRSLRRRARSRTRSASRRGRRTATSGRRRTPPGSTSGAPPMGARLRHEGVEGHLRLSRRRCRESSAR